LLVLEQPLAVRLSHFGEQRQAVALGEQQQRLDEHGRHLPGLHDQRLDGRPLARRGNRRMHQDATERLVTGNGRRERRQFLLDALRVPFLEADVKQGAGVPHRGDARGHRPPPSCAV
jgi:hypothetical protein